MSFTSDTRLTSDQGFTSEKGQPVTVRAPAKLNLFLHVTGRRADGYHEIQSLVVFTSFGDTVALTPALAGDGLGFWADGPFAHQMGPDADNLVLRAAHLLADKYKPASRPNTSEDVRIHLTKRLPVAAGIGGGSSDAAATLRGLARFWGLQVPEPELMALGLELGADVPMCLKREPVLVSGIGDKLAPAPELPWLSVVLVNPLRAVSTQDVFKARTGDFSDPMSTLPDTQTAEALARLLGDTRNDLTAAALIIEPDIGRVLETLAATDACLLARMSGSGATCFGLFADSHQAGLARQAIHRAHPDWWAESMSLF